jgi:tetratricopeptide (TPR) repeat protein
MAKKVKKLPHIYRFFSAQILSQLILASILSCLLLLIGLNIYFRRKHDIQDNLAGFMILNNNFIGSHIMLSQLFLKNNYKAAAVHELSLGSNIYEPNQKNWFSFNQNNILGISQNHPDIKSIWLSSGGNLDRDLSFWNKILVKNPDFTDALVMKSQILLSEGQIKEAKLILDKAYKLNPFNLNVIRMLKFTNLSE